MGCFFSLNIYSEIDHEKGHLLNSISPIGQIHAMMEVSLLTVLTAVDVIYSLYLLDRGNCLNKGPAKVCLAQTFQCPVYCLL